MLKEVLWMEGKQPLEESGAQFMRKSSRDGEGLSQTLGYSSPLQFFKMHLMKAKHNSTSWGFQCTQVKYNLEKREQRSRHEAGFPFHIQNGKIPILRGL